jgi:hypothetical protein
MTQGLCIATRRVKAVIVPQEEAAIIRQRRGKHVSAAANQNATIEELLEAVFSVRSAPGIYSDEIFNVVLNTLS